MIGVNHYSITEDALNNRLNDDAIYYVSEANRDSDVIEDENKFNIFKPYNAPQHFNKTTKEEGLNFLENAQDVVIDDLKEASKTDDDEAYAQALYDFGRLSHCIQDFYSHTNLINQTGPEVKIWNETTDELDNVKTTDYGVISQFFDMINPFFKMYAESNYDSLYEGNSKVSHYTMNKDEKGTLADVLYEKNTGTSGFELAMKDASVHTEQKWEEIMDELKSELTNEEFDNLRENLDDFDLSADIFDENRDEYRQNFEEDMEDKT